MLRHVSLSALVVLGCRVHNGQLSAAALRRVERAARAFREHGADIVIASGGKLWQGAMESDVFARELAARGVPRELVLSERESQTTRGNAQGVSRLLRARAVTSIGLVTCDWHMPRALRIFRRIGLDPIAVPAASPARPLHLATLRWAREQASLAIDLALAPLWSRP
jgi:uncharacterized SAM-binding protein YcdF (DUF218 family)